VSSSPINPLTGRRESPAFEGVAQALFEIVAVAVLAFVVATSLVGILYGCVLLWVVMLA
jgi:hypothetical protein